MYFTTNESCMKMPCNYNFIIDYWDIKIKIRIFKGFEILLKNKRLNLTPNSTTRFVEFMELSTLSCL